MANEADDTETLWSLLGDHAICMLVTRGADGLRARPMTALPDREAGTIFFIAGTDGAKDEEIAQDPDVCVTLARPSKNDYVSLTGRARVVDDVDTLRRLWNPGADAWFPDGPESPDVTLIRVDPVAGEYWEGTGSRVLAGLRMLEAKATGERPDLGRSAKVSL